MRAEKMTRSLWKKLSDFILEGVDYTVYYQFMGCTHKPGWMGVTRLIQSIYNWIKIYFPRIKVEVISQLMIVEKNKLPRSEVMNVYLPNCSEEQNGKILRNQFCLEWWIYKFLTVKIKYSKADNLTYRNDRVIPSTEIIHWYYSTLKRYIRNRPKIAIVELKRQSVVIL